MRDIVNKVNGNSVNADEFNDYVEEVENAIKATGITLTEFDLFQLSKSIANYTARGSFYSVTSVANAYTFAVVGSLNSPTAYSNGMIVRGIIDAENTAAATIDVNSLGVKPIQKTEGAVPLVAGDLPVGLVELVFVAAADAFDIRTVYPATETRPGKMALASAAEVLAGIVNNKAVTPATLAPLIADAKVKVSSNDTTENYLLQKITNGDGITITEVNDGGVEQLQISGNIIESPQIHYIEKMSAAQTVITMGIAITDDTGGSQQGAVKRHQVFMNGQLLINTQFNPLITPEVGQYTVTNAATGEITLATPAVATDVFVFMQVNRTELFASL